LSQQHAQLWERGDAAHRSVVAAFTRTRQEAEIGEHREGGETRSRERVRVPEESQAEQTIEAGKAG
jgi:hypothetical protein